jgi:hypothetical protein
MWNTKELERWLWSLLLVTVATTGFVSGAMYNGILPGFEHFQGGVYWHSPTKTYEGYFSVEYRGIFHHVIEIPLCRQAFPPCLNEDETVFYIETDAGALVRLIFFCGLGYCTQPGQVPLNEGARVQVNGTLIEPSQWQSGPYTLNLYFISDLYVIQYSNVRD